jgi:hypothetical protein
MFTDRATPEKSKSKACPATCHGDAWGGGGGGIAPTHS